MVEKESPTKIIETNDLPMREDVWGRFPGKTMENKSLYRGMDIALIEPDSFKEMIRRRLWYLGITKHKGGTLHTHPRRADEERYTHFASPSDMKSFLSNPTLKYEDIAQTNVSTGQVEGYLVLMKKKPWEKNRRSIVPKAKEMGLVFRGYDTPAQLLNAAENAYSANCLKFRYVPAPGFKFDKEAGRFIEKDLTSKLPVTSAIIGLIGGAFFLSTNVTGNVIGLSNTTSSWIGGVLFCVGLVSCFFWVKNKKK